MFTQMRLDAYEAFRDLIRFLTIHKPTVKTTELKYIQGMINSESTKYAASD